MAGGLVNFAGYLLSAVGLTVLVMRPEAGPGAFLRQISDGMEPSIQFINRLN